jgi:predicted O-methyltransferase YrrM
MTGARLRRPRGFQFPRKSTSSCSTAKSLCPEILTLLESRLKPGALVVADNADMSLSPDYLKRVRSPASGYMSVPFAEDVELSMRLG